MSGLALGPGGSQGVLPRVWRQGLRPGVGPRGGPSLIVLVVWLMRITMRMPLFVAEVTPLEPVNHGGGLVLVQV